MNAFRVGLIPRISSRQDTFMRILLTRLIVVVVCLGAWPAGAVAQRAAPPWLTVVSAGPTGEIANLAQADEIRVVFSEPMVTLGRIPPRVTAPFFSISPAVAGTFRWSGTTILIFMPDARRPLPYATKYEVTVDTTATAVSGRRLSQPYRFTFTTPSVKLLQTNWYRRGGKAGAPLVIVLRFNQPVRPADVAPHVTARFEPHAWDEPAWSADARERVRAVDPSALDRFAAKVNATRAVASARSPVDLRLTADWDRKRYPPADDMVVLETVTPVPSESWVLLTVHASVPSPAGSATPLSAMAYTIQVERAFFIDGFHCSAGCAPEDNNPLRLRTDVKVASFAAATRVMDVTDARAPKVVAKPAASQPRREYGQDHGSHLTLEDAGFNAQPPARTYAVTIDSSLQSLDGQTLGYAWAGSVENWHQRAFTSFGDGHGVWELGGGRMLPFYARNFQSVTQWAQRIDPADLVSTIVELQRARRPGDEFAPYEPRFNQAPPGPGTARRLGVSPDRIQSHGLDLSAALSGRGTGLVWAAVEDGQPIERSRTYPDPRIRASIVQVTNLGITVKDSPQNTLIFVTRLDTGEPVDGARVSIVQLDNKVFWSGTTGSQGTVVAPRTRLRHGDGRWRLAFVVMAEKDGDVAYVGSDWNEGIEPWMFNVYFDLDQADPMLRGTVFSDRGVYRLGEAVHFKAVLRHNTPTGIQLLPAGTPIAIAVRDSQNRLVDERTVKVNDWSSAEWTMTLPEEGSLGTWSLRATLESQRPRPRQPEDLRPGEEPGPESDELVPYERVVHGSFLVAAYRRPDFRVDVTLASGTVLAGQDVKGTVAAKYLFGAPMSGRQVKWTWSGAPGSTPPPAVRDAFPDDRWVFVGWGAGPRHDRTEVAADDAELARTGELSLTLPTRLDAGVPYVYSLEGDVEDVSRQHIANRASVMVHPAPWYVGVMRPSYFVDLKNGFDTQVIAVSPAGQAVPGVKVDITLTQVQWNSVRRAEGNGFYTWVTERKEVPAGSWSVTTGEAPVPIEIPVPNGGYFMLAATARHASGQHTITRTSFYSLGEGYTAWARYDHNRIDLVPDRSAYKPGDTARVMIQSPWERATALVTTEREGIRTHRQFALTSTQQSIEVPITDDDIPNVFVSVVLIKGRSAAAAVESADDAKGGPYGIEDPSDPGKPSFRIGYAELAVGDHSKRLDVVVRANKEEYRPANEADVRVEVKDHQGRGAESEVTLWAVDYGVLSLTAYGTPDVLRSVYVHKALQVMNADSRQRIVSRRVLTPKGETDGGGGGADAGAGTMRKDFRVLAFWVGSVITDAQGGATIKVKLPESLTTYRIMAVAGDRASRFGSGDSEVRINKPLTLKPAYPRFLAVGDTARFGAVVTSQLSEAGEAVVTMKSLDPAVLQITGASERTVAIAAGGSIEARFDAAAKIVGRARVQMTVRLGGERDAFEDVIPVEILASPETVAAYGQATDAAATETLTVPQGIVPGFGGLHVEMASTALVGLGEGARYLVEYPYGCAEQRGSRALAMLLAADLGDAFSLPGMDTSKMRPAVQTTLTGLERFQCPNGGFAYWPGACQSVSPYLTAYLLHVFKTAADLRYPVDGGMRERAYGYLERSLAATPPENESWWPSYTAWQAFAVKVLAEGGRNQDSNVNRIYGYRERMPVFGLAYLHDALLAKGETSGSRIDDLRRRMTNPIVPEGGSAHVEELADPYLLWFWNSNVRSTAIVLNSFVRAGGDEALVRSIVRWLLAVREDGRWGNTQENAMAMEALVAYYRKFESAVPDFRAIVRLGTEELARAEFKGRTTQSTVTTVRMAELTSASQPGTKKPVTFERQGAGTLFYTTRLRYTSDELFQDGLDSGIRIERRYAPFAEDGSRPAATAYRAGDLVRVTLSFDLTKERRFVAVTDPLPAGFEPVESWFATTARTLASRTDEQGPDDESDWSWWWRRGGFDHVERHDDRVQLFATRLSEGHHEFSYIVRATTSGTFRTAPARAEEMYEPEVFGRTATDVITVR
jgi:uncharacterized protein YfaS (alpha-2-macroglobulin family)